VISGAEQKEDKMQLGLTYHENREAVNHHHEVRNVHFQSYVAIVRCATIKLVVTYKQKIALISFQR